MKAYKITKTEKLPKSEVIIEGELSPEAVIKQREKTIRAFQNKIEIKGFRKGHVPEKILVDKVGELSIYEESATLALELAYGEIMKEAGIQIIAAPKVAITKISVGNPVGFKIEAASIPEIKLPDYRKIAGEIMKMDDEIEVTEKEIDQALDDMRRSLAHHEKYHSENATEEDLSRHSHAEADHTGKDIPEEELPKLDDEFAKKVANIESLDVLKEKMKESMRNEKNLRNKEKKRLSVIEKIIEETAMDLPDVLIESELNKLIAEFRGNLERMGIGYNEYLSHIKKEENDLRKELEKEAAKRAKIQIILRQIALDEKLEPSEEEVNKETEVILSKYKDVEKANVEPYVRNILLNEKVWQFLEEQK